MLFDKKRRKKIESENNQIFRLSDKTSFAVKEAFSLLRTNLIYTTTVTDGAPVFAITSSGEGAGKSTVVANLANEFAQIDKRVVLIDADMRYPVQYNFFGYPKEALGLSEILSGIVKDKSEAIFHTDSKNLDIIPSGHIPPNPAELFHNKRFADLIGELKREYDYIFVDFPPIGVVSDPVTVVNSIDAYLFVMRANVSNRVGVMSALEELQTVGANIAGLILNDVDYKDGMFGGDKYRFGRYGKYNKYNKYNKYDRCYTQSSGNSSSN